MERESAGLGWRPSLRGRDSECAQLDRLIQAIRSGESRSLVLRGEAGIGKTALLEYLVASASDLTLLRAIGVESEMELAYASLHQLCAPLLDRLEQLPTPQRQALEIVFGLRAGPPPDRYLVGLGVLTLLAEAAEQRPLLCLVDDAQWLDQASALTLAFVARRLLAEPVAIVFAAREPTDGLQHVTELEVRGLVNGDARALLESVVRFKLDEQIRDRIVAETRGNPLALLELPHGMNATELAGGFGLAESQGLHRRIEQSFVRRLEVLPTETRQLLVIAAAEPVGDPLLVWRAAEGLGIGAAAAGAAESHELLAINERVTFRHPVVRSAAYRSAAIEDRRAAHSALAQATDPEIDPDRRAWHLAAAAAGPDEQVALELERSAGRARARGGFAAEAAFLQKAVALSTDLTARAQRALAAAQASFQAGAFDVALRLTATAVAGPLNDSERARANLLRAQVAFASGNAVDAAPMLLEAAERLEIFDLELSRQTYLNAWSAAFVAAQLLGAGVILDVCNAVQALPPGPDGARRPLDLLLEGYALLQIEGPEAAAATLRQAARELIKISVEDVLQWGRAVVGASTAIWDDRRYGETCARQVQIVRDAGALSHLPVHLNQLAMACTWAGDFRGAASLLAEIDSVTAVTGGRAPPFALLMLRALEGRETDIAAAINGIDEADPAQVPTHARWAAAILFNGLGRYDEAFAAAHLAAANTFNPWFSMWALPELVEAAARSGDTRSAREAFERLTKTTQPSGSDWALGIEARCRALLSEGGEAKRMYQEAIERLGRTRLRPELARAHLVFGEWLRRDARRAEARAELLVACDMFDTMGMEAFAERARRELAATGVTVRRRTPETRDDLTAQERQITELAREGLSNSEIGARLFLSPRTVEWHLRNVFIKLGISSRRELDAALTTGAGKPPAV